jgi:hypothetical protein
MLVKTRTPVKGFKSIVGEYKNKYSEVTGAGMSFVEEEYN